ncbi:MAG: phosphotransferase [Chloroflexota bacterium]
MMRVPKPSYLRSRLLRPQKADAAQYRVLERVAKLYRLGEIQACHRAPRSNSLNFILAASTSSYVVRRQNLSKEAVAYEQQILEHLRRKAFPAPRMVLNQQGLAWAEIDGMLYSVYEFITGYSPSDFYWWPSTRRKVIACCGRALAGYHQATNDLTPTGFKWNGYRPGGKERWRQGDWFRETLHEIRPLLQKPTFTRPIDDFTRARIDALAQMLELEEMVEARTDLSKVVIHGDYAPWNVLFCPGRPPLILDFNESRLELKIYDIMLATFWFAWNGSRLNPGRVLALQAGYCETGRLSQADIDLAGTVFQWVMARSLVERLHLYYLEKPLETAHIGRPEIQFQMCLFAGQQPRQLVAGLKGNP